MQRRVGPVAQYERGVVYVSSRNDVPFPRGVEAPGAPIWESIGSTAGAIEYATVTYGQWISPGDRSTFKEFFETPADNCTVKFGVTESQYRRLQTAYGVQVGAANNLSLLLEVETPNGNHRISMRDFRLAQPLMGVRAGQRVALLELSTASAAGTSCIVMALDT